jgi:ubiquinone/menaquinone biosynthesis C-methylase UbiE
VVADGNTVLDVACGDGTLLALVRSVAPQSRLFGVDLSPTELRLARARLPQAILTEGRGQALAFGSGTIDVVLCHMALMLMDAPEIVVGEARRVLKTDGVFRAVTNRPAVADALVKKVMQALRPLWDDADIALVPPPIGDVRSWEAAPLAALVASHFARVSVECFEVTTLVPRAALWSHLVTLCYGFDALPGDAANTALAAIGLPDPVPWTTPMVEITAWA